MLWEKYVGGMLVLLILVFSYPYIDTEMHTSNFTDNTLGTAASVIVPMLLILAIVVLAVVMIVLAVKDIQKG